MATDPATWRPSVADVSALVAHRPGDANGNAVAVFGANTVPTATQVAAVIAQVQSEVAGRVGDMPVALATPLIAGDGPGATAAGRVVAVGAASYVELQFFPDLQMGGESPAAQLWERYQALLKGLVDSADDLRDDGTVGVDSVMPSAAFPATVAAGRATTPWERY